MALAYVPLTFYDLHGALRVVFIRVDELPAVNAGYGIEAAAPIREVDRPDEPHVVHPRQEAAQRTQRTVARTIHVRVWSRDDVRVLEHDDAGKAKGNVNGMINGSEVLEPPCPAVIDLEGPGQFTGNPLPAVETRDDLFREGLAERHLNLVVVHPAQQREYQGLHVLLRALCEPP